MAARLKPIPPGEVLLEEFLKPLALSQNALARALRVPAGRVNDIIHARRSITADSAARVAVVFGTSPDFWLNLHARYDAKVAERDLMPGLARRLRQLTTSAA